MKRIEMGLAERLAAIDVENGLRLVPPGVGELRHHSGQASVRGRDVDHWPLDVVALHLGHARVRVLVLLEPIRQLLVERQGVQEVLVLLLCAGPSAAHETCLARFSLPECESPEAASG